MKTPLLFIICLLVTTTMTAQSWQWGQRGGGSSNGLNITPIENVVDMDTDPNGNLYILARTESSGNPTIGATVLKKFGSKDIVVASFTCNGSLRWTKVIGSSDNDLPVALRSDTLGHIFVAGSFGYPDIHFDADTSFNSPNGKTLFLAQYDTSGNLKWFSQPASDTASLTTNYTAFETYDMIPGTSGGATMLCFLNPGLLAGGGNHVVTTPGVYFLNYNAAGAITSVVPVQMSVNENNISAGPATSFNNIRMVKTKSGKVLIAGSVNFNAPPSYHFSLGGQLITYPGFISCFTFNGQFLWKKLNRCTYTSCGFFYRPVIDNDNNMLLAGRTYGGNVDTLNGFVFVNTLGPHEIPFIAKLDSIGNNIWIKNASANGSSESSAVAVSNGHAYLIGSYPGRLVWDNFQFVNMTNSGYDPFLVTFDYQTGAVLKLDSLESNFGTNDFSSAMVSDKKGNLYIGGNMGSDLTVNNTTLNSAGGYSDFFIAKYGAANCGSVMPLQLLSFTAHNTGNSNLLQWTTAQEINVDRFEIERSTDGRQFSKTGTVSSELSAVSVHHYSYTDRGSSEWAVAMNSSTVFYRLKMIDKDGKFTYSNIVSAKMPAANGIRIYPNPARNVLHVKEDNKYNELLTVQVTDMQGKVLQQQVVATVQGNTGFTISTGGLAPGSYLVVIKGNEKRVLKFVKEK